MTAIEVRNLTFVGRGGRTLLDDVSLTVPDGSTFALCGPPGAGKTALLRVIVGIDDQTEGDVLFDDVLVNAVGPRERDVAMVFSDFALHPHLDVYDNLSFSSTLRKGVDRDALDDRVEEVAEFLALTALLDLKPADLDDAQRQRVAIGRSLVREAAVYLFDEPFSAQSDHSRALVRSVTTQWQGEKTRTSVVTTTDVEEALALSDHLAVMHRGVVHQVGSPRELYDRPADLFVAGFLGRPAMNLVAARPTGSRLVLPFTSIPMDVELERAVGDRDLVIVGIRPEQCLDATSAEAREVCDRVELTSRIDEVEWRGRSQLVYFGFELDPEVEGQLEAIEDALDFDLFQSFLAAELSAGSPLRAGMSARIVVPRDAIHVFDPETGENLTPRRS
ncbi:ABC transporter ATP-binding protein [Aeromicrobium terrae]|uniref:ABC transporter ATP-binding protein n=1 Tax=Aeromicrobium terrae TaxID=2498846 RepID=A0A5C8NKU0_9ACTN|nr:ABC transporter ATP-binding protein [Aeromicrobium terrae]TXL61505.1 ABC transporter ATP-binding protein [Aeromicrobium terrae]